MQHCHKCGKENPDPNVFWGAYRFAKETYAYCPECDREIQKRVYLGALMMNQNIFMNGLKFHLSRQRRRERREGILRRIKENSHWELRKNQ